MHTDYIRPRENGSRWNGAQTVVTDPAGNSLRVTSGAEAPGGGAFFFSISPCSQQKAHNYELTQSGETV